MVANRGHRSDGYKREASRPRTPRLSLSSRSKRNRYDQESVDSGYGGSSDFPSPQLAKHAGLEGARKQAGKNKRSTSENNQSADSDSDYDPKAKYYLNVDDDDYRNISFQGAESRAQQETREGKGEGDDHEDDYMTRHRTNHDRHRSSRRRHRSRTASSSASGSGSESDIYSDSDSDSGSDSHVSGGRSRRESSRLYSEPSRSRPRSASFRRTLSPILSERSEDRRNSLDRRSTTRAHSPSRSTRQERASNGSPSDLRSPMHEANRTVRHERPSDKSRRSRTRARNPDEKRRDKRRLSRGGSSSYKGAADIDDAWYKTFKERLIKGVDMNQVKKVGLDAAAVAAVKVAVGTQMPWKQRIPKTIAVGLAAAVTDFIVSKTTLQPKGMVGTMYARQLVEIALANLIINPASNKVHQKLTGAKPGSQASGPGAKAKPGVQTPASGAPTRGAPTRGASGRGRR